MANEVRRVQHYAIDMEDRVGAGARILRTLRDGDVNLIALWGYPMPDGKARLELVPDDPDGFVAAAKASGLAIGEATTAFYVTGEDRRGAVAETLEALERAGVNLMAAQGVSDDRGRFGAIVYVARQDLQRAATALNSA
jgi:hypothetical protein